MRTIVDPVFGTLLWRGRWIGNVQVPLLGRNGEIRVSDAALSADGRDCWTQFLERQGQLSTGVERALFRYLQTHREILEGAWAFIGQPLPGSVTHASEIWTVVRPVDPVWLNILEDGAPIINLQCDADWDEEHGLELSFCGNRIGVASGGMHWLDHDHYTLDGKPVARGV
jgi:hypothetical protein